MEYTWHPEKHGYGMLLEAEKSGIGTYAEGYRIERVSISLADAQARYDNVKVMSGPVPITIPA